MVGVSLGIRELGVFGYLKNICHRWDCHGDGSDHRPHALGDEFASLLIKHFILAMRLVANMLAGHSVLLGVLGLAISAKAVTMAAPQWTALATMSV